MIDLIVTKAAVTVTGEAFDGSMDRLSLRHAGPLPIAIAHWGRVDSLAGMGSGPRTLAFSRLNWSWCESASRLAVTSEAAKLERTSRDVERIRIT